MQLDALEEVDKAKDRTASSAERRATIRTLEEKSLFSTILRWEKGHQIELRSNPQVLEADVVDVGLQIAPHLSTWQKAPIASL